MINRHLEDPLGGQSSPCKAMWMETGGQTSAWSAAEALWPQDKVALVFHLENHTPKLTTSGVLGEHLGRINRLSPGLWEMRDVGESPGDSWVADAFRLEPGADTYGDEDLWTVESRTLNKAVRTQLKESLQGLAGPEVKVDLEGEKPFVAHVDVSEVYSPPRITARAPDFGLIPGTAMDLATGWDFDHKPDRKKAWRLLK